jgi:TRAP-type C4-dicarboxylate transport system substrate-binding protein
MRSLTKTVITITIAAALILAMTASMMMSATAHAESSVRVTQSTGDDSNSLRVTQSTEDGLEVECEGNLNCEIIGDDTVVATSEDNNTTTSGTTVTTTTATTTLDQSNITEFGNDFDVIIDEQDLGAKIEAWVDRLLDEISANLANLAISI